MKLKVGRDPDGGVGREWGLYRDGKIWLGNIPEEMACSEQKRIQAILDKRRPKKLAKRKKRRE